MLVFLLLFGKLSAQTNGENYIISTVPYQAVSDLSALTDANSNTTIQYFDGLGRLKQTVQRKITPNSADLVSSVVYDARGRESQVWLPAVVSSNNGNYYSGYVTRAISSNGNDSKPYSLTEYEASPLNRVTGQYGPGNDWHTNNKKVSTAYILNSSNVKYFYVSGDKLKCNGNYAINHLTGVRTTDEDGNVSETYTDKQGRTVLVRGPENSDTYYVYDDFGNLRYVLPPLAADNLGSNTSGFAETTGSVLDLYGYIYHYDKRNRCVEKKLPGADVVYMVYDRADRLILVQNGNQRDLSVKQWTVYKYDKFGRLLYSGIVNSSSSRIQMEGSYSGSVVNETYNGNAARGGYSSTNLTPVTLLSVNYYDNYSFLNISTYSGVKSKLTNNVQSGYTSPDLNHTKSLLTGTCVYHVDDPTKFELTTNYYDKYGRLVQTKSSNHLGGYDLEYHLVDFVGKTTKQYKTHGINGSSNTYAETYTNIFDKAQRLLTTRHKINSAAEVTILTNTYNELGQLATKKVGGSVDQTNYSYNVRGWLTGINGTYYNENLYYNTNPLSLPSFSASYNGNIAGMKWSIPSENIGYDRTYSFSYNSRNMLEDAIYSGKNGTSTVSNITGRYDESVWYDKMGNITQLTRYQNGTGLNDLTYSYNGNQLKKVDNSWSPVLLYGSEAFNDRKKIATEYLYDKNGNTIYDANAGISAINYNSLNLPYTIQFADGHQNWYSYDATGRKMQVINYTLNSNVTVPQGTINPEPTNPGDYTRLTTDYIGNKIYQNGTLKQIQTPVGYWQNNVYYYYLNDHLGNVRVVINSSGSMQEKSHYYPLGMRFFSESSSNSAAQPFRYNGKEYEAMNGLNRYDYGARMYDPALGRWHVIDNKAEKYFSISPYVYAANNPIRYIDPDGNKIVDTNGNVIYTHSGGWSNASVGSMRIGNAMMGTPVGLEMFNALVDADYEVTFTLSGSNGSGHLGEMDPSYNKDGSMARADITIFEDMIKDEVSMITEKREMLDKNPGATVNTSEKGHTLLDNVPTVEERIGQVSVHEGEHATNPQAQEKYNPDKKSRESYANTKEIEAIRQTPEYRLEEIQSLPGRVSSN